jgi:TPR repeat protein
LLSIFINASFANEYQFSNKHLLAYQKLSELKIIEASYLIQELDESNAITLYLQNVEQSIKLLANGNPEEYEKVIDFEDNIIEKLEKFPKKSPYHLFLQAEIKLHWALIKYRFGDNLKAFWSFKQSYALLKKNQESYPDFLPQYKTLGLMMAVAGAIPEQYEWLLNMLGFDRNVKKGISYLQKVVDSQEVWNLEAQLLYLYLQAHLFNEPEAAFETLKTLVTQHPENLTIHLSCAWIGIRAGKSRLAYQYIQNFPKGENYLNLYFTPYLEGICLLQTTQYELSLNAFEQFIQQNKSQDYVKDVYYKMFLATWFLGKPNAENYLKLVKEKGATNNSPDKYAMKFAHYERLPLKTITEARILTDGGELEMALKILQSIQIQSIDYKEDKAEYHYRLARIYHKLKNIQEAIRLYELTIIEADKIPRYFAPYSCLMLGFIYKDELKNKEQAIFYFEKAISYKHHEYKQSTDNQAKTSILELK